MKFSEKIGRYIKKNQLLRQGDEVAVGVSGGADSVALLLVLCELKEEFALKIRVMHVEHGIRGKDSLSDAAFVQQLCEQRKIPFCLYSVDAVKKQKEEGKSLEEAARDLRYEAFFSHCGTNEKIAIAHNANDNAETMIFQLIRGTGMEGLCGIRCKNKNIIRPLLGVERKEIEAYLKEKQQRFCTDQTNKDETLSRNRIRLNVMPQLLKINAKAILHMTQTAELMEEMVDEKNREYEEIIDSLSVFDKKNPVLNRDELKKYPGAQQAALLHFWLRENMASARDVSRKHIESLVALLDKPVGKCVDLPGKWYIENGYGTMVLKEKQKEKAKEPPAKTEQKKRLEEERIIQMPIEKQQEYILPDFDMEGRQKNNRVQIRLRPAQPGQKIPEKNYTKWFDYDKIKTSLLFRHRHPGDYLTVDMSGKRKKFRDYCIDEKIPKDKRKDLWLLCDGSHVLWIVGYRISEFYKVDESTERILAISFLEESKK